MRPSHAHSTRGRAAAAGGSERSALPAIILVGGSLLAGVLLTPRLLEHALSLDWRIGNLRPFAHVLQILCFGSAAVAWRLRARINVGWGHVAATPRESWFWLVGIACSVMISLVGVEMVMRMLDIPFRTTWTPNEYARAQFDREIGWVYKPNWSGMQPLRIEGQRVDIPMSFDEDGLRVPQPGWRYDRTRPSVLFVGCSFTVGFGLRYEDTFVGQIAAMPDFPLQAVNLGVEAYGTDQALLLLQRHLARFNTKAVVYNFIVDHIPRNANYDRRLSVRGARFVGTKPLFALDSTGRPYLKKTPQTYEEFKPLRFTATLEASWERWGPRPSLDLTAALITEMRDVVESHGATFLLVVWDWDQAFVISRLRDGWPPFRELGVNLIDTGADAPPDWKRWRIPGDSHPNARADARVARLIADKLRALGVLDAPPEGSAPACGRLCPNTADWRDTLPRVRFSGPVFAAFTDAQKRVPPNQTGIGRVLGQSPGGRR